MTITRGWRTLADARTYLAQTYHWAELTTEQRDTVSQWLWDQQESLNDMDGDQLDAAVLGAVERAVEA